LIGDIPAAGPATRREVPRLTVRYFLISCLALAAVAIAHFEVNLHVERSAREAAEQLNVELGRAAIARTLVGVTGDLMYLARLGERSKLFDPNPSARGARDSLAEGFRIFAEEKRLFDQVRFLDLEGREIVRVNFAAGLASAVPDKDLQDKAERYYVRESLLLDPGAAYVSPLDLNVEHGRVEEPLKPMLRFATPVAGPDGSRSGILVLNYLGETLLQAFRSAASNIGDHVTLLDGNGYWLSSPSREDEWGFMLPHGRGFAAAHPGPWARIAAQPSGSFRDGDAVYTFATIDPAVAARGATASAGAGPAPWKVVSRLSPKVLAAAPVDFLRRYAWLYAILLALEGASAFALARMTARRRLADAQAAFAQRFREILENVSLLAVGLDEAGRVVFANDALARLTGRGREALAACNWFEDLVAESHRESARELFRRTLLTRESLPPCEIALRTEGNARRLVAWHTARLSDDAGRVIGVTCIGEDVTEARRAEQDLRKVLRAVEQSPSTVMITDIAGRIDYVNPKFTQLTGYSLDEVRGKNPRILKSGETGEDEYRELWSAITSGGEWRGVFHNRKKNGELYWEAACISPIRGPAGQITHLLAVKEDITERRQLEEEVERRKREAARNQALAEVGRMANMVAHDLRNPLSSVKMTLQILGRRLADRQGAEERELREIALQQVRYMEEILSDMLSYSRPDSLEPEWLAIDRVLETAILVAEKHLAEAGARVTARYRAGLPTLYGDAAKLRQAFVNVLANAAQATEGIEGREPLVEVATELELREDGPWIRVEIRDNGRGLERGQEQAVFEPFYTTRARGTGLGLAIVRRMVELHGGAVRLERAGQQGTCAIIELPARAAPGHGEAPTPAAAPAELSVGP